MFEILVSDAIRYGHLLAVALGLGISLHTEFHTLRHKDVPLTEGFLADLEARHRLILGSVAAMWVTGLAIMALRTGFRLDAFSPKLWTKLAVVAILTANAMLISRAGLPLIRACIGRRLTDIGLLRQLPLFAIAGISTTSWLVALLLGSSLFLKTASAGLFLTLLPYAYGVGIGAAIVAGVGLLRRRDAGVGTDEASAAQAATPLTPILQEVQDTEPAAAIAAEPGGRLDIDDMPALLEVMQANRPLPHRTLLPHRRKATPENLKPRETMQPQLSNPANTPQSPPRPKVVRRATEQRLRAALVG